jgi:hypothetical protein
MMFVCRLIGLILIKKWCEKVFHIIEQFNLAIKMREREKKLTFITIVASHRSTSLDTVKKEKSLKSFTKVYEQ